MLLGTLVSIYRYPVKSLKGETLVRALVEETGIPGDRHAALFVRAGHARTGKPYRGKEHGRLHLLSDANAAVKLAHERGVEAELRTGGRFFDDAPISLLIDRWLEELGAYVGYRVEPERFRPNFFVRAVPGFAGDEASLCGAELALGDVRLRARSPIERCVVTTYDPLGGAADPEILRFIAQRRNARMGIYCDVLRRGHVRAGDLLTRLSPS
jgi:uncharacterized protein YcbX